MRTLGPEDNGHRPRRPSVVREEQLGASTNGDRQESHFHVGDAVRATAPRIGSICLLLDPASLRLGLSASTSLVTVAQRGFLR